MNNQLKFSFKKEFSQFWRTFRLMGIVILVFSFALSSPLMFKFVDVMMSTMFPADEQSISESLTADSGSDNPLQYFDGTAGISTDEILGDADLEEILGIYSDAGFMFATTLVSFATYSLLIIMILLMPAAGGEQKKRAMIVPMCSGLKYNNYLLPKFIIYPAFVFSVHFLAGMTAGGLCNMLFSHNKVSFGAMTLGSALISVYTTFIVTIFLAVGLCTSRPGVAAPLIFVGQMILETLLDSLGITDYHPIAIPGYINAIVSSGYVLSEHAAAIAVSVGIAVVVGVLMYFLTLGVLKAKKINNQEEETPEF